MSKPRIVCVYVCVCVCVGGGGVIFQYFIYATCILMCL